MNLLQNIHLRLYTLCLSLTAGLTAGSLCIAASDLDEKSSIEIIPHVIIPDIQAGIEKYIEDQTEQGGGYFPLRYEDKEMKLKLVRVHTEYLANLGPRRHFACVDLACTDGNVYDSNGNDSAQSQWQATLSMETTRRWNLGACTRRRSISGIARSYWRCWPIWFCLSSGAAWTGWQRTNVDSSSSKRCISNHRNSTDDNAGQTPHSYRQEVRKQSLVHRTWTKRQRLTTFDEIPCKKIGKIVF